MDKKMKRFCYLSILLSLRLVLMQQAAKRVDFPVEGAARR
jgi:hypothetical protein